MVLSSSPNAAYSTRSFWNRNTGLLEHFKSRAEFGHGKEAFKKMASIKTASVLIAFFIVGLGLFSYAKTPYTVPTEYKVG